MPTDDDTFEPEGESEPERNLRRLRERAKQADDAEARALQAERKLAIHEADIAGLTKENVKALVRLHDSDDLTPEAIKATAVEYGILRQGEPEEQTPADERQALERMAAASNGGGGSPPPTDPLADLTAADKEGGQAGIMAWAQRNGIPTSLDGQ